MPIYLKKKKIGANIVNRHVIKGANKYMKRCSISLVIKEMENESSSRCHSRLIRMANIKNTDKSSAGENVESLDLLHTAELEFQYNCLRKCIWQYPLTEPATLSSTESTEIDIYMH